VELEIEEDLHSEIDELTDQRRSFEREQTAANLETACDVAQRSRQCDGALARFDIERD
jgi:hypothetical protein